MLGITSRLTTVGRVISADGLKGAVGKPCKTLVEDVGGHGKICVGIQKIGQRLNPMSMPPAVNLHHADVDAALFVPRQKAGELCHRLGFGFAVKRPG